MINTEEAHAEIGRMQQLVSKLHSWETYSYKGSDLKGLVGQITDLYNYVVELEEEVETLKKAKTYSRVVYKSR